ncbi:hypothetical protein Poly59_35860 [Rubripirellula reticaptiva]|uniref:Uncharacterized protein n=1 Tax=Rubripirellula reticaptiva TaxID=2528013 RepID=A0A5C6EX04_9BACT|nr:hypothetical protein Poly59_35860 [Rubripirellula reticaptiva]
MLQIEMRVEVGIPLGDGPDRKRTRLGKIFFPGCRYGDRQLLSTSAKLFDLRRSEQGDQRFANLVRVKESVSCRGDHNCRSDGQSRGTEEIWR